MAPSLDSRQRASCITLDQHANRRNLATAPAKTPLATDRRTARTRAPRSRRLIPPESRAIWKLRGTGSEWPTDTLGKRSGCRGTSRRECPSDYLLLEPIGTL